jgi:hypothetical protein
MTKEQRRKLWQDVLGLESRVAAALRRADEEPVPARREFLHSMAMNQSNSVAGIVWAALDRLAAETFGRER